MVSRTGASDVLLACQSWGDLHATLAAASEGTKGEVFEALVQAYLRLDTKYDFKNVWSTHGDLPKAVLTKLNLFNRDVTGIDLVAETSEGKFWAVQAKYHRDEKWSLSRKEATGLIAGRNRAHGEFELGLICTTANGRSANLTGEPDLEYLMGDVWRGLDAEFFARLHEHLRGLAPEPPAEKTPRPHQREALDGITTYFADHSRGKVVMPCATGKSLIGFWSAEKLGARRVLVAVPNLSLVRQLLKDWTEQSVAHGRKPRWIVVCSDDTVADIVEARDLGVKVDTDPATVAAWLREHRGAELSVVFTTYQSGRVLSEAAKKAGVTFDLGIFDEAHRTAGRDGAPFAYLLSDDNVTVDRRLFMTATPRIYKGTTRDDVISMDNPAIYGGDAFEMTFLTAMGRGIIPNLTIVVLAVTGAEVERLLRDRRFLRLKAKHRDEVVRTEDVVAALALRKAMKQYGIHRTLGFHSSKKRCRLAGDIQRLLGDLLPQYGPLDVFHVDGDMTSGERDSELRAFEASESALLTNVRVFVEGVDCPSMDAVIFADPRQSTIDVVQGVGRALRPYPGKEAGFAIIPTVVEDDGSPSDRAYAEVVRVTCALGSTNKVILDYFAAVAQGKAWSGPRVFEVAGDVDVGVQFDLEKVNRAVAVRTYARTVEWRPFNEAREFARGLHLSGQKEWFRFARGGRRDLPPRPADIPAAPHDSYADEGWAGYGDWLGTNTVATKDMVFRPFDAARSFVRALKLQNAKEWKAYSAGERKDLGPRPSDIPGVPDRYYADTGWDGWSDFLGTDTRSSRRKYRMFRDARAFVRQLRLATQDEWYRCSHGGIPGKPTLPDDIPGTPHLTYRTEWKGMGDWLGTKRIANQEREFRTLPSARRFARSLKLRSAKEWFDFCRDNPRRIPEDVPKSPQRTYRDSGWVDWGDFLGTKRIANREKTFWPFKRARTFVRRLRLGSFEEWVEYSAGRMRKLGKRPNGLPSNPSQQYAIEDWKGWSDFLGNGNKPRRKTKK